MLKNKNFLDANFIVTGGTVGCRYDNLQCYQSWQSWHDDELVFFQWMCLDIKQWISSKMLTVDTQRVRYGDSFWVQSLFYSYFKFVLHLALLYAGSWHSVITAPIYIRSDKQHLVLSILIWPSHQTRCYFMSFLFQVLSSVVMDFEVLHYMYLINTELSKKYALCLVLPFLW